MYLFKTRKLARKRLGCPSSFPLVQIYNFAGHVRIGYRPEGWGFESLRARNGPLGAIHRRGFCISTDNPLSSNDLC